METISFDEFKKLDLRIGTIKEAEKIETADKLLKLTINIGDETRIVVAGIAESHQPESLIGKQIPVLINLEPRILRGVESQGMILAASIDDKPFLLHPEEDVPPGTIIR